MKAPKVNIKEILGKLSFLTNNLALLVAILIAIVALLGLIPTRILGGRLRKEVEKESVGMSQTISRLSRTLTDNIEGDDGVKAGYINALTQDANEIDFKITQTVMREFLRYDIFPDTNETSTVLYKRFGQAYVGGVDKMLADIQAGVCPAIESIQEALKSATRTTRGMGMGPGYEGMGGAELGGPMDGGLGAYGGGAYGGIGGSGPRFSKLPELQRQIFDQVCLDAAKATKVYALPENIGGFTFWNTWEFIDKDTAFRDCWYWQLGYWIVEDVMTTIETMNERADNVLEGPVKRLMNVEFTLRKTRRRTGSKSQGRQRFGGSKKTTGNNPVYVTNAQNVLALPCTGRVTNEQIDVVQFSLRVVIDAGQVLPFMQELCSAKEHKFRGFYGENAQTETYEHNQITVLEGGVNIIDKSTPEHELYRYGDNPVVELDMICEYVLPKIPSFEELKPKQVLEDLQEAEQ